MVQNHSNPSDISTVGIIGDGKMGTDIFTYLSDFDLKLVFLCFDKSTREKSEKKFQRRLSRSLKNEFISTEQHRRKLISCLFTIEMEQLSACDLLIECINENLQMKRELFSELDEKIKSSCIFSSNTSSIPLGSISPSTGRQTKFIGLHFFYPVSTCDIVEVNYTEDTDAKTLSTIRYFLTKINRAHIVLPHKANFLLNKLFLDFQAEAYAITRERDLSFSEVDTLIRDKIFPIGVFEFFDSVGLDIILLSVWNYQQSGWGDVDYTGLLGKLTELVHQGCLGQKTGKGFYSYSGEKNSDELPDVLPHSLSNEVTGRLMLRYLKSAAHVLKNRYCTQNELDHAVREYMGVDVGPCELIQKL